MSEAEWKECTTPPFGLKSVRNAHVSSSRQTAWNTRSDGGGWKRVVDYQVYLHSNKTASRSWLTPIQTKFFDRKSSVGATLTENKQVENDMKRKRSKDTTWGFCCCTILCWSGTDKKRLSSPHHNLFVVLSAPTWRQSTVAVGCGINPNFGGLHC